MIKLFSVGERVAVLSAGHEAMKPWVGKVCTVAGYNHKGNVVLVECMNVKRVVNNNKGCFEHRVAKVADIAGTAITKLRDAIQTSRTNDPATSKQAAISIKPKKPKIKEVIIDLLLKHKEGLTGQEIADFSGYRLNSITPRFAELRRDNGFIKVSGVRNKQTVWQLTGRMV
jgi:hypothetical protein